MIVPPSLHRALAAAFAALVACSGSSQHPSSSPAPVPDSTPAPVPAATAPSPAAAAPDWLAVDTTAKTATLTLEVTAPPGSPSALINGHRAGAARVVVPLGWTVKWSWRNADSTSPHSLAVMVQREKIPLEGGRPAFSNAMTRMATEGLPPGGTDQSTFVADEAGWYWMLCGVPSHALEGEWLELRVDPEAKEPRLEIKS